MQNRSQHNTFKGDVNRSFRNKRIKPYTRFNTTKIDFTVLNYIEVLHTFNEKHVNASALAISLGIPEQEVIKSFERLNKRGLRLQRIDNRAQHKASRN